MQQSPSLTRVALDTVLDRTRLSAMCGMPVRASRLRIKPDTSIVMALVSVDAGTPVGWARLLWPDSRGKADKAEHWAGRHALRLSSTETDNGLIFQHGELLTDAKLGAYLVGDSAAITKAQHDDAILRYNPARRLVYRSDEDTTVTRIAAQADPMDMSIHKAIADIVATPTRLDDGRNLHRSVHTLVGDGDLTVFGDISSTYDAGEMLAELHRGVDTLPPLVAAELQRRGNVFAQTEPGATHARVLDHLSPDLAAGVRDVAGKITDDRAAHCSTPRHTALLHGDASPDQVLFRHNDGALWLTDFDRTHLGDPATDLGTYLSVVDQPIGEAFLAGYAAAGGALPSETDIRRATAHAMLMRLAEPLRAAEPDWEQRINEELDRIKEVLP